MAMGMPLHSHRDIHSIMPLMVIVIGQVIHRHRYASTHSFVFSLVSEIDVVRLGIALIQWSLSRPSPREACTTWAKPRPICTYSHPSIR